jgi:hypothetical protein
MDGALSAEPETLSRQRHVSGIATVEIFAQSFGDAVTDAFAQRIANVEIFP